MVTGSQLGPSQDFSLRNLCSKLSFLKRFICPVLKDSPGWGQQLKKEFVILLTHSEFFAVATSIKRKTVRPLLTTLNLGTNSKNHCKEQGGVFPHLFHGTSWARGSIPSEKTCCQSAFPIPCAVQCPLFLATLP